MNRVFFIIAVMLTTLGGTILVAEDTHWDYEGEMGPEYWGELVAEFDMCAKGRNQSPIDLMADIHADLEELVFQYANPGHLEEVNTGHAIQENVKPGNFLVFYGDRYELKQFHFHSPSEHTVAGESFPMEVHLVHQNAAGDHAVVGLLFQVGEFNKYLDQLPSFRVARGEDPHGDPVDYNEFIGNRTDYFVYNGSLTTPPCSEGVQWIVLKEPIIASPEQIQHYYKLLGFDNNRPIQPHNSRLVLD